MKIEKCFSEINYEQNTRGIYQSGEVPYIVFEVDNEEEALDAVRIESEKYLNGMTRKSIEIDERINDNTFKLLVKYEYAKNAMGVSVGGNDNEEDYGDNNSYSFDTSGGTQHITQSLGTVSCAPLNAPNLNGAIGYDGDNVNGVDITVPIMVFSETHVFANRFVSTAYKKTLANLTGCINNAPFKGYASGEVLFQGASGSYNGNGWEITFNFSVSINRSNINIGNLVIRQKLGWDYMWVRYANNMDSANSAIIKTPVAAYVERVYPFGNFAALGIGR